MKTLTIACISDTHTLHRELEVPNAEIIIHAGDFTTFGRTTAAIVDFNAWLGELPHKYKIITCGNHELNLEADPSKRNLLTNAIVLINEGVEIMGLKVW